MLRFLSLKRNKGGDSGENPSSRIASGNGDSTAGEVLHHPILYWNREMFRKIDLNVSTKKGYKREGV